MSISSQVPTSKGRVLSGVKVSVFTILLALGFASCQSETIEPKSDVNNNSKSVQNPDKGIVAEKPPREPDPGGN